ncbi:hypothetical protein WKI68_27955 [Streptomyces sp. MS1.HAVA.3]|uniref:Basic proline-rich protein-like n=1 Tax=Streptomyces caledonius TaxID=3134107 RepID=A0ABU8U8A5_9ACTN
MFLDETSMTEALPEPAPGPGSVASDASASAAVAEPVVWQADPLHQAGFGGPRDHRVSWGSPPEPEAEPGSARPTGISLARTAAAAAAPARLPAQAPAQAPAGTAGILSARSPAAQSPAQAAPAQAAAAPAPAARPAAPQWPDAPGAGGSGLTSSWPEAAGAPRRPAPKRPPHRRAGSPGAPRPCGAPPPPPSPPPRPAPPPNPPRPRAPRCGRLGPRESARRCRSPPRPLRRSPPRTWEPRGAEGPAPAPLPPPPPPPPARQAPVRPGPCSSGWPNGPRAPPG